jgi:cell division protease FtsH
MFDDVFDCIEARLALNEPLETVILHKHKNPIVVLKSTQARKRKTTKIVGLCEAVKYTPGAVHEKEAAGPPESPLIGELPEEVLMFVKLIQRKKEAEDIGLSIPNVLLVGQPGCGKTHLARHIAHLSGLPISAISAAQIHSSKFVGDNIKMIDETFEDGKNGIVFLDELDAIGNRSSTQNWRTESITHLLSKLDGFQAKQQTILIAATNDVSKIDEALIRQGRFDRVIHLDLPNLSTRRDLLVHYSRTYRYDAHINFKRFASETENFSFADVRSLPNEAALHAFYEDATFIRAKDFEFAIENLRRKQQISNISFLKNHRQETKPIK